ncbi:MAG: thiamine pyrophosphate-dependent enzyme [Candidatus Omnitrophica bacterium]|nr:thiamine pyrophosphate-dependent enzyme [Candidatus Omnitrophota bacterium]
MISACKEIRKNLLKISHVSGHGHIPSCFSVIESIYAVYSAIRHDSKNPSWNKRDIFILSKGHAALAHYCILADFGYFDISAINSFGAFCSNFGCHACRCNVPGIEVSTGSLGHGIGVGVGMALAFKIQKNDRRVFVLIGDGEANEGTVWEAVMVATDIRLDNLTVIYDNNMSQLRGLQIHNPYERFKAFGCDVAAVNGHDVDCLKSEIVSRGNNTKIIIANTKKGYGCKTLIENQHEWHRKSPDDLELKKLLGELDEEAI